MFGDTVIAKYLSIPLHQKRKLTRETKKLGRRVEVLTEFEDLFIVALGDWDTEPVSFELKEGAKPYHSRAFPIPKVHKENILNAIKRLIEIGVEWQPSSEWAAPSFIQPKKNNTVRFLLVSDFRELNKRLVRKPFPIPKISTVLHGMS